MYEEWSRRLIEAAAARDQEALQRERVRELAAAVEEAAAKAAELKEAMGAEERDVRRLERPSLTRLLATLLGNREARLQQEQAEAHTAQARWAEALRQQQVLLAQLEEARRELDPLAGAETRFQDLLAEKEQAIRQADPEAARHIAQLHRQEQLLAIRLEAGAAALSVGELADRELITAERDMADVSRWETRQRLQNMDSDTDRDDPFIEMNMEGALRSTAEAQACLRGFADALGQVSAELEGAVPSITDVEEIGADFYDGDKWTGADLAIRRLRRARTAVRQLMDDLHQLLRETEAERAALRRERETYVLGFGSITARA